MKKICLLFFCCFFSLLVFSQTDSSDYDLDSTGLMEEDSLAPPAVTPSFTQPVVRRISDDSIAAIKRREPFAYMQYADSFFRNKKMIPEKIIKEDEQEEKAPLIRNPGLRMLYWLLAIAVALWVIGRMFIGKNSLFTTNAKLETTNDEHANEIGQDLASNELIDKEIKQGNYRLATRYLYLQTLQLLGEKELISLAPQKTNYQYLQELDSQADKPAFSKLTLRYEYAWFGDFKLSTMQFNTIHNEFMQYQNAIAAL